MWGYIRTNEPENYIDLYDVILQKTWSHILPSQNILMLSLNIRSSDRIMLECMYLKRGVQVECIVDFFGDANFEVFQG